MSTYRMAVVRSDAPVADGDVLVHDDTDGTWVPSDAPAGSGTSVTDNGNGTSTIEGL